MELTRANGRTSTRQETCARRGMTTTDHRPPTTDHLTTGHSTTDHLTTDHSTTDHPSPAPRAPHSAPRTPRPAPRAPQKGFTLIELLIVVTIIGILAGLATVSVRHAQRKTKENVLMANLALMRKAIDDFYADRQRFPSGLQELVDEKYMRSIPKDTITESADTWIEIHEDVIDTLDQPTFGGDAYAAPGIVDVQSGAEGETLDGRAYGDL
jgi:general secretion pathway protein G